MTELLLSISNFIHLVSTVVWIGGMLTFVIFVWPQSRRIIADPTLTQQLILQLQRRFRPIANFSLVLLLGTGMLQMGVNDNYEGVLQFTNTWSIAMLLKHIAFGGIVILSLLVHFGLSPAIERAVLLASQNKPNELDALLQRESKLTWSFLGLAGIVLCCTAIATAL